MPSFLVDFTAYIDENRRPDGFPREVHIKENYTDVPSTEILKKIVNDRFVALVTSQGLVVFKNPDEIYDQTTITFDKRVYIPWHMITHMHVSTHQIIEIPEPDPQDPIATGEEKKPTVN